MAKSLGKKIGNTKTRTLVMIIGVILIVGVIFVLSQSQEETKVAPDSRTISVPSGVQSTPGSKVSRKYRELQEQANQRGSEEAAKEGKTFIPTLLGNLENYEDSQFEKMFESVFGRIGRNLLRKYSNFS